MNVRVDQLIGLMNFNCSGVKTLKSARCVLVVIVYGSSEKLQIWYPTALLLTLQKDETRKSVS